MIMCQFMMIGIQGPVGIRATSSESGSESVDLSFVSFSEYPRDSWETGIPLTGERR